MSPTSYGPLPPVQVPATAYPNERNWFAKLERMSIERGLRLARGLPSVADLRENVAALNAKGLCALARYNDTLADNLETDVRLLGLREIEAGTLGIDGRATYFVRRYRQLLLQQVTPTEFTCTACGEEGLLGGAGREKLVCSHCGEPPEPRDVFAQGRAFVARVEASMGRALTDHIVDLFMDNAAELGLTEDECLDVANVIRADKGLAPVARWWSAECAS